ncbi:NrtA/SsuA/CpmA family ABC transporter substrate-binding protein [Niallia oryzisoli]|uniref:NrtA/SsuA/CpmA family ABC transporter substrate-binding protein n=1 Tax=Niallia oryzisoli TaxID=1737571 RepID=A0ABZ2CCE8_9BACI
MKKVRLFLFALSIIASLVIAGCSSSSSETTSGKKSSGKETVQVRMAIDTAAGGSFQFRTAEKQGYFEKYGIEAQISNFAMGVDTINAVLTKQADTGLAADYVAINSIAKGDLVIIGTLTRANEKSSKEQQLLVKGNINKPSDLKGKKIGVNKGTVNEYVWSQYLKKNQLKETDVEFVPYSTPDEAIVGMQKGDIEAVWASGALLEKFKAIEGVHQIDDLLGAGVSIDSYLLADRTFVEQNPEAIANLFKALNEGIDYVKGNKEDTANLAFEQLKIPADDALKDIERQNYVLGFTKEDVEHLEEMKNWIEEKGLLKESFDLKDKLMLDPLKQAFPELVTYQ